MGPNAMLMFYQLMISLCSICILIEFSIIVSWHSQFKQIKPRSKSEVCWRNSRCTSSQSWIWFKYRFNKKVNKISIARTTNHCWTWYDNQAGNTGRSKTHWSVQFTKCYNEWLLRVSLCSIGLVVVYLLVTTTTTRQSMGKETFVRLPVFDGLCLVPHCQYGHVGTHSYG